METITSEQIEAAVSEFRAMLQLDGADLTVASVEDTSVTFALDLARVDCTDCVLPAPMIESMLANELAGSIPQIGKVVVNDPRLDPAFVGTPTHHP